MAIGSVKTADRFCKAEELITELVNMIRYELSTDFDDSREEALMVELEALGESLHDSRLRFDRQRLKDYTNGGK